MISKHRAKVAIIVIVIIALFAISIRLVLTKILPKDNEIAENVRMDGFYFGGLNIDEAKKELQAIKEDLSKQKLEFTCNGKNEYVSFEETGFSVDVDSSLKELSNIGRSGNIIDKICQVTDKKIYNDQKLAISKQNLAKYNTFIEFIKSKFETAPVEARFDFTDDKVEIIKEKVGKKIDESQFERDLIQAVSMNSDLKINVKLIDDPPIIDHKVLEAKGVRTLLSKYTTKYNSDKVNRIENIRLAVEQINNCELRPGERFSFNEVVGPRSAARGFKEADVIVNSKYVKDLGGGICQVSSTIYNAAVLANLKIISRRNHSIPVSYVPLGQDATVAYPSIDFVFENSTSNSLIIEALIFDDSLTIRIFGTKDDGMHISITSQVLNKIPPKEIVEEDDSLPEGEKVVLEEGTYGYKVKVYKVIEIYGEEIDKQVLSTDTYKPQDRVIKMGTKILE